MPVEPELLRALGALCEPPDPAHPRIADALGGAFCFYVRKTADE